MPSRKIAHLDLNLYAPARTIGGVRASLKRAGPWVSGHPFIWTMLIAVASLSIAWLRLPPVARDTLWAEDGRNFLQDALDLGPLDSLFIPYAGYLHTLPRIIAAVTVESVPVSFYALAMTAGSCIAAAVMASIVFVCSRDVVRWMPARVVIALVTVLAPLAPREVSGNTANLHSLVLWTMFWMLLYRPRTRIGSYLLGLTALLGGLTEIQTVFLAPLLIWRIRDRGLMWPRIGYLAGVAIQLSVTLIWPRGQNTNPAIGLPSILYGFLINSVIPIWIPQGSIGPALAGGGITLCLILSIPFVAALFVAVWYGSSGQRVCAFGLFGAALVVYGGAVFDNPDRFYDYATMSAGELSSVWLARYGVVPSMMLCALIPLAATVILSRTQARIVPAKLPRTVSYVVVSLLLLTLLLQFGPQFTRRSGGPAWSPQIAAAQLRCEHLPDSAIISVKETIGWRVNISCERL